MTDGPNVIHTNSYDPYGIPASTNAGRFQYTGQAWIPELQMYYYKARIYSPTLGRFLQTDPIGYEDQMNLYAYAGNDPVNFRDPRGAARACADLTGSRTSVCVTVDADFDDDGKDDLNRRQLNKVGNDFRRFIERNRGDDISRHAKPIVGDGSLSDKAATSVVSQFVGASVTGEAATRWGNVANINVGPRSYTGDAAWYRPFVDRSGRDTGRGTIFLAGRVGWFSGGYLYDSPSNLARALLHEMGHTRVGVELGAAHHALDDEARRLLKNYGLSGGGCWSTQGPFGIGGGFPGC